MDIQAGVSRYTRACWPSVCTEGSSGAGAQDEGDKMLVVERGDLVFVFNFHPVNSFSDYRVGAYLPGPYKVRVWQSIA